MVKWPEVFEGWKRVHSSARAEMFRTVAGAWCTSHRMHEAGYEERRCFFGCSGEVRDNIVHNSKSKRVPFTDHHTKDVYMYVLYV